MHIEGPYRHRSKWRCRLVIEGRRTPCPVAATPEAATRAAEIWREKLQGQGRLTVQEAAEEFLTARREDGVRESSLERYELGLRRFFGSMWSRAVAELKPARGQALYDELRRTPGAAGKLLAVDTHRADLIIAKGFCGWLVERGMLKASPLAAVKGVGRRLKGKQQPRVDEARKLHEICLADPSPAATAVLLLMWTAARSSELLSRTVRDVDDGGRILCIEEDRARGWKPKSDQSRRQVEIPEHLRGRVLELCRDKVGAALLWEWRGIGHHRNWLRDQLLEFCERAGIPPFCPHALRGWNATAQARAGVDLRAIAEALGHSSSAITERHYIEPGSGAAQGPGARVLLFKN